MTAIVYLRYLGFGISIAGLIAAAFLVFRYKRFTWRACLPFSWIANVLLFYSADVLDRTGIIDVFILPIWSVFLGVHAAALFTGWFVVKCLDELRFRLRQQ